MRYCSNCRTLHTGECHLSSASMAGWWQAAQSDALSRPSMPMASCVWAVQAAPACQPVLASPSGPPAGGVPSRVREPGGSTKPSLLPQPDFSKNTIPDSDRLSAMVWSDRIAAINLADRKSGGLNWRNWPDAARESLLVDLASTIANGLEEPTWSLEMSGGGGQTGSGPRVVPTPDPVPGEPETLCEPSEQDKKDRRLFDAISRGGRRGGPGVVWEGNRRE